MEKESKNGRLKKNIAAKAVCPTLAALFIFGSGLPVMAAPSNALRITLEMKETKSEIERLNDGSYKEQVVDTKSTSHTVGRRNSAETWDNSVFYVVEGFNSEPGYYSKRNCKLVHKSYTTAKGNKLSCDVYVNPDTGKPNKIVALEYVGSRIEVTECYYNNSGKPVFTFRYKTDNYVSTYATPDKQGVRCLFKDDMLVTWRVIDGSGTKNYAVGQNQAEVLKESWDPASIVLYQDMGSKQSEFDDIEREMLNFAYEIYGAAGSTDTTGRTMVYGRMLDDRGNPMPKVNVSLYSIDLTYNYYNVKTDNSGVYLIYIPYSDTKYNIVAESKDHQTTVIHDISSDKDEGTGVQTEDVNLVTAEENVSSKISVKLADDKYTDDDAGQKELSEVKINIREGIDNKDGEVIFEEELATGAEECDITLDSGSYTVEVSAKGCETSYKNITLSGNTADEGFTVFAVPEVGEDHFTALAVWEGEIVPYAHLFAEKEGEDAEHTFAEPKEEEKFSFMDIDSAAADYFKYCIVDQKNALDGKKDSKDMSESHLTVYVYSEDGLEKTFNVPTDEEGVLWEVFDITKGDLSLIQRYYQELDEAEWWKDEVAEDRQSESSGSGTENGDLFSQMPENFVWSTASGGHHIAISIMPDGSFDGFRDGGSFDADTVDIYGKLSDPEKIDDLHYTLRVDSASEALLGAWNEGSLLDVYLPGFGINELPYETVYYLKDAVGEIDESDEVIDFWIIDSADKPGNLVWSFN